MWLEPPAFAGALNGRRTAPGAPQAALCFAALPSATASGWAHAHSRCTVCSTTRMRAPRAPQKPRRPAGPPPPSSSSSSSSSSSGGQDGVAKKKTPERIDTTSSTLSLRQQIQLARSAARAAAADGVPSASDTAAAGKQRERTKFRRKKTGFTSYTEVTGRDVGRQLDRFRGQDVPDGKYEIDAMEPIVLIDAYNIVGAWPKLRKHRDRGNLDAARDALLEEVYEFSSVRGWDCVVVFDAHGTSEAAKIIKSAQKSVITVFTGSETADAFIERRVFELCEADERQVWVATSDTAESRFAQSKGAHIMSASLFVQELKRSRQDAKDHAKILHDEASVASRMLIRNVDEETRRKLYRLRSKLSGILLDPTEDEKP